MPRAERTAPPYVQIQDHFRGRILSGEIAEGDRLPSIAAIAEEWGVAPATAAKAMAGLGVEGYTVTSTQGTYATVGKGAVGARDLAMLRGRVGASGNRVHITEGDVRAAPVYVAELLGMEPAIARVARREWVTYDGSKPIRLSVSWWSADLAGIVPRLGTTEPGDPLVWIQQDAGRSPTRGRDYFEGREADLREAGALGIRPGAPVLASTHLWWDDRGVIEYGEFVLPRKRVVSLAYAIDPTQQDTDQAGSGA